jgi:hypothetical protein
VAPRARLVTRGAWARFILAERTKLLEELMQEAL